MSPEAPYLLVDKRDCLHTVLTPLASRLLRLLRAVFEDMFMTPQAREPFLTAFFMGIE